MRRSDCTGKCCENESVLGQDHKLRFGVFTLGLLSLLWLALRTGQKPSRINYPCQKTALANVMLFFVPAAAIIGHGLHRWAHRTQRWNAIKPLLYIGLAACAVTSTGYFGWHAYQARLTAAHYQALRSQGAFGRKLPAAAGAAAVAYLTVPHAMALPSPHRVVSVRDPEAGDWTFPCTSSGSCRYYYGDDGFVDQAVVDAMVARGVRELTGAQSLVDAWGAILPDYQVGQTVAIKVNFNDTIAGGGNYGYADDDAYLDALPQIVNSIVSGLTAIGVDEEDIWVFDASRHITDRFRAGIDFAGIRYFDANGNGDDVEPVHYASADASARVAFTNSTYSGSHRITDLLVYADYLINVPIMKRHGGTGITLSLKNHMGSINGFLTGVHAMHDYIELGGSDYESATNPLVDINLNPNIRDKTVLIVGDAVYGAWSDNNTPPERWSSFDNDSPNMLFFSGDPVAVDSVMFDYITREIRLDPRSEDILLVAAEAGLGVHERWNNNVDRQYQTIDYVEIDLSSSVNQAPNATISSPDANVTISAGQSLFFAGRGLDPDGNTLITYLWNFGAGSGIADTAEANPGSVQFNTTGVFTVTLTVTDAEGVSDPTPASRVVTVNSVGNQPPNGVIDLPTVNEAIMVGRTVTFSATGSDPDGATTSAFAFDFGCGSDADLSQPLTFLWRFGNGSGIADIHVEDPGPVQFNTSGVFTVTLAVTDAKGASDPSVASRTITVGSDSGPLPQDGWQLLYVDSEELAAENGAAENAFDSDPSSLWHTAWMNSSPPPPHEIQIDLGATHFIDGFRYLPRQDGGVNGRIGQYEFYVSNDPLQWGSPVATGGFPNTDIEQEVAITRQAGRYIRLRAITEANGFQWTSIAEINVVGGSI